MRNLSVLFFLMMSCTGLYAQYSTTPILLSLPMDADTIEEDEPLFVWQTTLSNAENDPRLNLKLIVVKVAEDQTSTEAIAENPPVFIRQNLLSTSVNYSEVDHELQEGKWYAWQVVLLYNGVQVQQSEVFKFIKAQSIPAVVSYHPIKLAVDNSFIETDGKTLCVITDEGGDFNMIATISGNKISPQQVVFTEAELENEAGGNVSVQYVRSRYFTCDLSDLHLKKGNYRIQWNAASGKQFTIYIKKI